MNKTLSKVLILFVGLVNLAASAFLTKRVYESVKALPEVSREVASEHAPAGHGAPAEGAHGAPAAPAGEHGAAAPAAPAVDAHGNPIAAKGASDPKQRTWVALEEMYVNVVQGESDTRDARAMAFKIEVELFDENARQTLESHQAVVKNAVIEVARQQDFDTMRTVAGKLYFKEALVEQVNETLHSPLVRDIHLASFSIR